MRKIDTEGDPSDYIHKFEDAWLEFILLNGIQGFDIWFYRKQIITMYCIKSDIPLHSMTQFCPFPGVLYVAYC